MKGRNLNDLAEVMAEEHIKTDELDAHCQKGKELADEVMNFKKEEHSKADLLPLQGKSWEKWCEHFRAKKRPTNTEKGIHKSSQAEQTMKDQRQIQDSLGVSPFMQTFINGLTASISSETVDFYLRWLKLQLDGISQNELPPLLQSYLKQTSALKIKKKAAVSTDSLEQEILKLERDIDNATLGVEHLMREVGQIYEAAVETGNKKKHCELPKLAAQLLLKGESFEIMDGDASGVPMIWVEAVFAELEKLIGKKKLFTLSVLGVQSSGKSTLLNTMFGLQFPVSAGRCTRGVYLQLIKVDDSKGFPFSYIAVIDSEGLRAQEIGDSKYDHDNELATFVIGLGNVTLINSKGENVAEIEDILQIVAHAFLRMKMVNKDIQNDRSCVFIHQNVNAVDANVKLKRGLKTLVDTLDQMTVAAAASENIAGIQSFDDVIGFNDKNVWYFPDLFDGNPPMASVNTDYHEKVKELKAALLNDIATECKYIFGVSELRTLIKDMWLGVLADDFIFSYKNSMVTSAYKDLDNNFSELKWMLELSMKEWRNQNIKWKDDSTQASLQKQCERFKTQAADLSSSKQEEAVLQLNQFIDKHAQKHVMEQWRKEKEAALDCAAEAILASSRKNIDDMAEKEAVNILKNREKNKHKDEILKEARCLAEKLKGKPSLQDAILKQEFDKMWNAWLNQIDLHREPKHIPISERLEAILSEEFPRARHIVKNELSANPLSQRTFVGDLANSQTLTDIEAIIPKTSFPKRVWNVITRKHEDSKVLVVERIAPILREVDINLQQLSQTNSEFNKFDAQKAFRSVRQKIDALNDDPEVPFSIPTNANIHLVAMVASYSLGVFENMQTHYDLHHGVRAQLEAYKQTTWNMFMNVVRKAEEEIIVVDMICDEIEQQMEETISKQLQFELVKVILPHFTTKAKLIKAVLHDLAERGSFKEYQAYIKRTKSFSMEWMETYIDKFVFRQTAGSSWYVDCARRLIQENIDGINKSVKKVSIAFQQNPSTVAWIDRFSKEVSSVITFTGTRASRIAKDEKCDFKNLEARFAKRLSKVQTTALECFTKHTMQSLKWMNKTPHEEIVNSLWGCEALCPFCKEPCIKSDPNHASQSDCHKSIQHRPQGVASWHGIKSKKLVVENCSYAVQSAKTFICQCGRDHVGEVEKYKGEVIHPFKEYKRFYPHWEIPPSPDMASSHYWMWYLNKFQYEAAKASHLELPDMPVSWKDITKGSAIESLSLYD